MWFLSKNILLYGIHGSSCDDVRWKHAHVMRLREVHGIGMCCSVRPPLRIIEEDHLLLDLGWAQVSETEKNKTVDKEGLL